MKTLTLFGGLWTLTALAVLFLPPVPARAQTFRVDFARWTGPPLVKTKHGVYQTPFFFKNHPPAAFDMTPLLKEAGVQDMRYEMGWGKPDTYAYDQISGTAADPQIDFTRLDPFLSQLARAGITPLLAMTYDPLPLQTRTGWQRWKDVPQNLNVWQEINRRYAAHYGAIPSLPAPFYEMWNEPDLPGDGGKVFFSGKPDDYALVYGAGARGVHDGSAEARAGGPAIAYDLSYASPLVSKPIDFVSIHAYKNYAGQLSNLRGVVQTRPDLPILLTEYASYDSFGADSPASRHAGAERFFADVKGMLHFQDVPKVYWAQWIDNNLGMITEDLHRKALFNAYKIYQTLLPVDRNAVTPDGAGNVDILASSDDHNACAVVWNDNPADKTVTVNFDNLPFAQGVLELSRIDGQHGSYVDNASSENLSVDAQWPVSRRRATWTGIIPAQSVVLLRAADQTGRSLLERRSIGRFVHSLYWFPNRASDSYADFDPHTSIARLGSGGSDHSAALIGNVIEQPAAVWKVVVKRDGSFAPTDQDGLFAIRIDYGSTCGGYHKSVLWHDGSYHAGRTSVLPWGTGKAVVDKAVEQKQMRTGASFTMNVAGEAPADWNHQIILTPILQHLGAGSQARIIFSDAGK